MRHCTEQAKPEVLAIGHRPPFVSAACHSGPFLPPSPSPLLNLVQRAEGFRARSAIFSAEGAFEYSDLLEVSGAVATRLLAGRDDLSGERVCYLVPPGWSHVVTQWGIWRAGGFAVPLATSHPPSELAYVVDDTRPEAMVVAPGLKKRIEGIARERAIPLLQTPALVTRGPTGVLPEVDEGRPALMLYTSGTTGRPKGVVIRHRHIRAQVEALSEAWGWTEADHILLHLPLHHVHGIVNVLTSALWNGAVCEILPRFRPVDVWERLSRGDATLYMAVPTVYRRLIEAWEGADTETRSAWSGGARHCRLMVSGSAALPVPTLERWEQITGHRLLERYGMTEIGMGLSNPLEGERRPGFVGVPLPGVEARLVDEGGVEAGQGASGLIEVRGPGVFDQYWERPAETAEAFTEDGWFRTGDQAVVEDGAWRILGRSSVDILKTGGEKISALEIEDALRQHPAVADCAVVGVADLDWGDRVCAALVLAPAGKLDLEDIRAFAKERLAPYKVPKDFLVVSSLPRNAMGKVTKLDVRLLFAPDDS